MIFPQAEKFSDKCNKPDLHKNKKTEATSAPALFKSQTLLP